MGLALRIIWNVAAAAAAVSMCLNAKCVTIDFDIRIFMCSLCAVRCG